MSTSSTDLVQLPSPPFDSISAISCSPVDANKALVGSWDTSVRLYSIDTENNGPSLLSKLDTPRSAILDVCWSDDGQKAWCAGLEGVLRVLDLQTGSSSAVSNHEGTISSMVFDTERKAVITGGWDSTLHVYDQRANNDVLTVKTPERVYAISSPSSAFPHSPIAGRHNTNRLVVAMASRLFGIWDLRNLAGPVEERESSLKYMTRSLGCMLDGEGFATASVEGRIAVEYFDPSPAVQEKKYAFKCHRTTEGDVDKVYPVNGLAFHPIYNTFASYGSDGTVSIWDHKVKKRLRQYTPKFEAGVTAGAFNCDGTKLLLATGPTWDNGNNSTYSGELPAIHIRQVGTEVKPKSAA
ncbi:WD40 repeat-like protein [Flagelloscypha sp. PMI_526]|nr:WD40 repeat-like protein [Flagelloscypha sp. PMI_526]